MAVHSKTDIYSSNVKVIPMQTSRNVSYRQDKKHRLMSTATEIYLYMNSHTIIKIVWPDIIQELPWPDDKELENIVY